MFTDMAESFPQLFFAKSNLFESSEVVLKNLERSEVEKNKLLETLFWDRVLRFQHEETNEGRATLLQYGWQQSWLAIRLLDLLYHKSSNDAYSGLDEALSSSKKETFFTSLLQFLEYLNPEDCEELKGVFSKVLLASLISRENILPKLNSSTEESLFKGLIGKPGETHLLLNLISCDHEAFVQINKEIKSLYTSAITYCINNLVGDDVLKEKASLNVLYALLLLMPLDERYANEEIGRKLYALCQNGELHVSSFLTIVGCQNILYFYTYISECESRCMLRHVNCSSAVDVDLVNNVFNVITSNSQLRLEELCLRTLSSKCHWVDELIEIATQLVVVQDQQKLDALTTLPSVWPALAINVWKQLSNRSDILDIISPIIYTCQKLFPSIFGQLHKTLERLKVMTTWLRYEGVLALPDFNAMLALTRNHSPLFVLQSTTHFVDLNHKRLQNLLLQLEGPNSWNVRVFEGFTILFSAFHIFVRAVDIFNESDRGETDSEAMYSKFKEEVSKPILKLSKSLNRIEPIQFRIELLEDFFLLLFLRSEDFSEEKSSDESSPDENEDIYIHLVRSVSDGASLDPVKPASLPSRLYKKYSSPTQTASSSSYPSSSKRRYSNQNRHNNKAFPFRFTQGFVCYPWLVRDVLSCLKESIGYTETILDVDCCNRLRRLKESVEDASWRLDMVSESDNGSSSLNLGIYKDTSESWVYTGDDSSDSDISLSSSSLRKSSQLKRLEYSSRSESSSNVPSGVKFSSSTSSMRSKKTPKLFSTTSNLINLMLASPTSLVFYFITKEDLHKATRVVQKFNLKGCAVDVELNFLKEFSRLRKNLSEVQIKSSDDLSSVKVPALQVISDTTASGVLTVTLTKLIEMFFAMTPLPEEFGDNKGVVVLDLALSHAASLQHSACLLDLARNYFNTAPNNHVLGMLKSFTVSIRTIIQESEDSTSLPDILLNPCLPLKSGPIMKLNIFWSTLQECLAGFRDALMSGDNDLADASYLRLTACIVSGQGLVQNYQDDMKQHFFNQMRSYLLCLWKVVCHSLPGGTQYHILEQSLNNLIGDLIFCQGKNPVDIEASLKPLPINVVNLVVSSCTPSITITKLVQLPPTIVLNCQQDQVMQTYDTCKPHHVESLLMELLTYIGSSPPGALHSLPLNTDIQRVLKATCHLQQLNYTQFPQGDQLFAFLINLHNLLWLHALILLEIPGSYGLVSPAACFRDLSASFVGYLIGKDCFVSIAELRSIIAPIPSSTIVSGICHKSLPVSISSDPRALFLLGNPYKLSPIIQVLPSHDLDREIDTRMTAFIEANVKIVGDCVTIPITLYHYIDYVTLTQGTESEFSEEGINNSSREHIIDFLREFFKQKDISDIVIQKDIALTISISYSNTPMLQENIMKDNDEDKWKYIEARPEVLKYLAARNPLLGLIVEKFHFIESGVESFKTPAATTPLERQLNSNYTNRLAKLYDQNVMMVTLKSNVDQEKLWLWFETAVQQQDWFSCLEMLSSIPEKQYKADPRFSEFRDWLLEQLSPYQDGWLYCRNIGDPQKLFELTMVNLDRWSLQGCITMFNVLLSMDTSALPGTVLTRARQLETNIQTTNRVRKACSLSSMDDAWAVVEELIKCDKVNLALQWFLHCDLIHAEHSSHTLLLVGQLILELLERGQETSAQELLLQLPNDQAMRISENIALKAQSVSSLQQIVHFLKTQTATPAQSLRYEYLDLGVHMLNHIPWQELECYRNLVGQPELLIEQLLMTTRISTLETILQNLQWRISSLPPGSPLTPPCLDALLRRYAAKAIDVKVRTKMLPPRRQITPEISSKFIPPDIPPKKQEWIGNDEVTVCMCCETTAFSMFNRRHHCRRCGRVICGVCSPHRFKVFGYSNVKVRICNDCYDYILPKAIHPDMMSGPRSARAQSRDSEPEWWLTKDLVYNATVREEFTYTHAPSVSLCLSILKLHSEHSSLLRFLFTTIETMLQLLRPICPGTINPEVDYSLLVNMIRSLLEFANLSCSQHGTASDWATVDGLFAEVDLLGMLVSSPHTCALLPAEPLRGHSALGTLRENLLKSEQWTLALEVSTKAGLDYNSVWLAWGKACLKAGAWTDARVKFAHCNPHKKDTQMLVDILQVLQDNPQIMDLKSRLCRLRTLSCKPDALHTTHSLDPRVHAECLYYLRTYGTHASTISFYLDQNNVKSAVSVILEYPVDIQTYLESLFLPALRSARVTQLYQCMSEIDKTLTVFKEYLRASCAYCERHQLFHVLYQAQVWMNDHVRAAMTCIRFFEHNARSYKDLSTNRIHLETALGRLQLVLKQNKEPKSPLVMHLPKEGVVRYISTIRLQLEVTVFMMAAAPEAAPYTLFGSKTQRVNLASSIIVLASSLEESFSLATKVTEDWQVEKSAVLCSSAAQLVKEGRFSVIRKIVTLLEEDSDLCNKILLSALKEQPSQAEADLLIALISDVPAKITSLIDYGQLKSAYLLAVKHDRLPDIYRIMEAAVKLDQPLIRKICLKRLNIPDDI